MKYIDAKHLKAEINKRLKNVRDYMNGTGMRYKGPKYFKAQGKESAYDALLSIIDSLQQEQPKGDLVAELKHHLTTTPKEQLEKEWKELEPWGNIGPTVQEFLYGKQQPEVDLEKKIDACWQNWLSPSNQKEVEGVLPKTEFAMYARHFAQWGAEHAKECEEKPNKVKADFDIYRFQQKFCIHCEIPHCTGTIDYLKSCPYLNK